MTEAQTLAGRRILAAIDVSRESQSLIHLATRLSAHIHAELTALLVEDIELLRLAGLPFAREIDLLSAVDAPFTMETLELTLRSHGERVRAMLAETTQSLPLPWTCEVVRGDYMTVALEAASEMDVVLLNRSSWRLLAAPQAATGVVVPVAQVAPVWVLYDGSQAADRTLNMACDTAGLIGAPLRVLLPADTSAAAKLREQAATLLENAIRDTRYVSLAGGITEGLLAMTARERCSLILLPRAGIPAGATFKRLLQRLGCPVLLVP